MIRVATQDLIWAGSSASGRRRNQWSDNNDDPIWHRMREDDPALAVCSFRIVLNTEDASSPDARWVGRLCGRCFRHADLRI